MQKKMQAFRISHHSCCFANVHPFENNRKSISLSGRLNLSSYNSAVPVPNNITRRSYNAVIHSSQISLLVGLSNRPLEEWGNQGCASRFNSEETAFWNRPKYLSSTSHLTPD